MNQVKIKLIFFTILSIFISNCSNLNSTFINDDTKNEEEMQKTPLKSEDLLASKYQTDI